MWVVTVCVSLWCVTVVPLWSLWCHCARGVYTVVTAVCHCGALLWFHCGVTMVSLRCNTVVCHCGDTVVIPW